MTCLWLDTLVPVTWTIGLIGDIRDFRSHQELNALIPQLMSTHDVSASWVPTGSNFHVTAFDGLWLVPGSPYDDDDAVERALRQVRKESIPFLGTCSGMQYAVLEFVRTELNLCATHAETDGLRGDNAVVPLSCSLDGAVTMVVPRPGSRFAHWVSAPFEGVHFCSYAASPATVAALRDAGVVVGATSEEVGAEVLEFPDHPFYVTSMYQPHIGASEGAPIDPLVRAFLRAVTGGVDRG